MSELTQGTVTGRFEDINTSAADLITGFVYFTPEADFLVSEDSVILMSPAVVELSDNQISVDLAATDNPYFSSVDWTYRVDFDLKVNGQPFRYGSFFILVPAGVTTDLASVAPVAASGGTVISRGIRGSRWHVSTAEVPDYADVTDKVAGDIFLYPASKDYFIYNGSTWDYVGNLAA